MKETEEGGQERSVRLDEGNGWQQKRFRFDDNGTHCIFSNTIQEVSTNVEKRSKLVKRIADTILFLSQNSPRKPKGC